jgi:hypothetical protein
VAHRGATLLSHPDPQLRLILKVDVQGRRVVAALRVGRTAASRIRRLFGSAMPGPSTRSRIVNKSTIDYRVSTP